MFDFDTPNVRFRTIESAIKIMIDWLSAVFISGTAFIFFLPERATF